MTVPAQTPISRSNGNGVTTVFAYAFKVLAATDLLVEVDGVALAYPGDYSVSGVGVDGGGSITCATPPANGAVVVRRLNLTFERETDYQDQGELPTEDLDNDFDRLVLMLQQLDEEQGRSLTLPPSLSGTDTTLPDPVASALLGWNPTADKIVNYSGLASVAVSAAMTPVVQAATVAAARSLLGALGAGLLTASGLTMSTNRLLGRTTAGTGAVQELTAGGNLRLASTNLDAISIPVRQTVLSGPINADGTPNFGGATGGTSVNITGPIIITAAGGGNAQGAVDRVGSLSGPSWTGLSTNGTWYLYADIAADGTCTAGQHLGLAPVYQDGGAAGSTVNQFTFNIQEMIGRVGNGSGSAQAYRVYIGEAVVSGGVVSSITWYALMGRYQVGGIALPAAATATTRAHNIGSMPRDFRVQLVAVNAIAGYAVGDSLDNWGENSAVFFSRSCNADRLNIATVRGGTNTRVMNKGTGADTVITATDWSYRFIANRGW